MPICTYINDQDIQSWSKVTDKELNDLLQEVRTIDDRYLIYEYEVEQRRSFFSSWFRKTPTITVYSLRVNLGYEAQIINFPQEHDWSINTSVTKSYIMTYLYGFLAGHMQQQLNKQQ